MRSSQALPIIATLLAVATVGVGASPVTGDIGFSGTVFTDNADLGEARKLVAFDDVRVGNASGSYSEIPINFGGAIYNAFDFDSAAPQFAFTPLWAFTLGTGLDAVTYSFDATSWAIKSQSDSFLHLGGVGYARITGLEDTISAWDLKITADGRFGLSVSEPVPESGATAALVGSTFIAAATLRRRLL